MLAGMHKYENKKYKGNKKKKKKNALNIYFYVIHNII